MFRLLNWLGALFVGGGPGLVETYGVEELRGMEDWRRCLAASDAGPVFVFKHSTTCPISAGAQRRVARYLAEGGEDAAPVYLVKVIESRAVSNAIADDLGVRHQSPQAVLLHGGRAVWDASHGSISETAMLRALAARGDRGGAV